MQNKRTASVPIFNRGKRPRQALLSHPNNAEGRVCLQQQPEQNVHWSSQSCLEKNNLSSRYNASANSQRQNAPAPTTPPRGRRPAGYNQSQRNKENVHSTNTGPFQGQATRTSTQTPPGSHQRPPYDNNSSRPSLRGSGYTPRDTGCTTTNWKDNRAAHHTTHQTHTPSTARPVNMAPDFSVPGRATEPTQHQSAKIEPLPPPPPPPRVTMKKQSHLPRLLTATAKGVEHWSQYKGQIPMLFEIFGALSSAVVAGPLSSREFSVQAGDGTLRCLYWEMDTTLPHIVRGKPIRVVGSWDERQRWIKCHCVREASQQEMQCVQLMVASCDSTMRETVAKLSEM